MNARTAILPLLLCLSVPACNRGEEAPPAQTIAQRIAEADNRVLNSAYKEAAVVYEGVLKIEPQNAAAIRGLGEVALHLRDYKTAEERLKQSAQLNPNDANTFSALGATYEITDRFAEAAEAYRAAAKLVPDRSIWHLALGRNLRLANKLDEAEKVLTQLSVDDPKVEYVFSELGDTLRAANKDDQALVAYMKAQSTWRSDKAARAGAAMIYEKQGETSLAVTEWSEYLRMDCCSDYSNKVAKVQVAKLRAAEQAGQAKVE